MMAEPTPPTSRPQLRAVAKPELGMPPHDLAAEAAVLSAIMFDEAALARVSDLLRPEHFYSEAHRRIFEAAQHLREKGLAVDSTTIGSRLNETHRLAQVGGIGYLIEVMDASPAFGNVRSHATAIFERWRQRQIVQICQRASASGYGPIQDVQVYADDSARALAEIARLRPGERAETNIETLRRIVKQLGDAQGAAPDAGAKRGIPTGIAPYDMHTLGLHSGQKTTIVAHPRVGKTAFALQIAVNVAKLGIGVAFFSTEMPREELADRQIAMLASVDGRRLRQAKQRATLSQEEWARIDTAMVDVESVKFALTIYDDAGPSIDDVRARAKAHADQAVLLDGVPLGLVVVDYIQKLRPTALVERRKKHEQVGHATQQLKNLARELRIPVLELAQQKNTEIKAGKRRRPELGDAADSYEIERSADNVVYIYRPQERNGRDVKLFIAKQRGAEEHEFPLTFEREYSRFVSPSPHGPMTSPSRQYVPDPERDADYNPLTDGL